MAGKGNPNIHKYGFGANPQNINRKGRPKSSWSTIGHMLQQRGVEKLSKDDLVSAYQLLFNATEEDLEILMDDEDTPFVMKAMIKSMADPKMRDQMFRDLRDYMFGKTAQVHEHKFVEQPLFPSMDHRKELSKAKEPLTIDVTPEKVEVPQDKGN